MKTWHKNTLWALGAVVILIGGLFGVKHLFFNEEGKSPEEALQAREEAYLEELNGLLEIRDADHQKKLDAVTAKAAATKKASDAKLAEVAKAKADALVALRKELTEIKATQVATKKVEVKALPTSTDTIPDTAPASAWGHVKNKFGEAQATAPSAEEMPKVTFWFKRGRYLIPLRGDSAKKKSYGGTYVSPPIKAGGLRPPYEWAKKSFLDESKWVRDPNGDWALVVPKS